MSQCFLFQCIEDWLIKLNISVEALLLQHSNYNRINPDDVVYTKSPTGVFLRDYKEKPIRWSCDCIATLRSLHSRNQRAGHLVDEYFSSTTNTHNYLYSIIQKGAKNTINITNRTFLSKDLKVPSDFEEQKKIGQYFSEINKRIDSSR